MTKHGHPTVPELKLRNYVFFFNVACIFLGLACCLREKNCFIEEEDFDDYAEEFEEHLVNVLEYRLPQVGSTDVEPPPKKKMFLTNY